MLKRLLVHVCGLNLGLLMRHLTGVGTPRSLQGRARTCVDALTRALGRLWRLLPRRWAAGTSHSPNPPRVIPSIRCHQTVSLALEKPLLPQAASASSTRFSGLIGKNAAVQIAM